jgi:Tfp pilus assembly protein PilN
MHRANEIADARVAELRAANAQLSERAKTQDQLTNAIKTLSARKSSEVPTIGILSEITELIPDGSWLVHLQLSSDRIVLSGFSANPSEIVRALESSPSFTDVRFSAPVTRDQDPDLERFHITLTVQRGAST